MLLGVWYSFTHVTFTLRLYVLRKITTLKSMLLESGHGLSSSWSREFVLSGPRMSPAWEPILRTRAGGLRKWSEK